MTLTTSMLTPPDWRIGCIFTSAKDSGRGIAAAAVAELYARYGFTRVRVPSALPRSR